MNKKKIEIMVKITRIMYLISYVILIAVFSLAIALQFQNETGSPSKTIVSDSNTNLSIAEVIQNKVVLTLHPDGKGGEYFSKGKIIVIYPDALPTYEDALQLFNHEYGHYLFHDRLYWYERTGYDEDVYADANTFVSEYARDCTQWFDYCTRYEEDFAETFAYAMRDGEFNINYVPEDRRDFFESKIVVN